jgi:hypothetical protein
MTMADTEVNRAMAIMARMVAARGSPARAAAARAAISPWPAMTAGSGPSTKIAFSSRYRAVTISVASTMALGTSRSGSATSLARYTEALKPE